MGGFYPPFSLSLPPPAASERHAFPSYLRDASQTQITWQEQ